MKLYRTMSAMGMVPDELNTISENLANQAMMELQLEDNKRVRQGKTKVTNTKTKQFASTYLQNFMTSLQDQISKLERDAVACKRQILDLRKTYEQQIVALRRQEGRLSKAESEAKSQSLFCRYLQGVVVIVKNFLKTMTKNVIKMATDILSGDMEFSFSEIKKRVLDDTISAASTAGVQALELSLSTAAIAAERSGGAQAMEVVNQLSRTVHSVISDICSGPVRDVVEDVKEYSDAAMNPNPYAVVSEELAKKTQKVNKARKEAFKESGGMRNLDDSAGASYDATVDAAKEEFFSEQALEDYAKMAAKTGLSAGTNAFPPAKAVAAATSILSDSYLAFCKSTDDLPAISILEKNSSQARATDTNQIKALRVDINNRSKQIDQTSKSILNKINDKDATDVEIIQYDFCVSFLIQATNQLSFLSKTFPYMDKDGLVTLFFSYLGDSSFEKARNLLNANMLSMLLRGFFVFVEEELQHTAQGCPLLPKGLADQIKARYNLTQTNFCKSLSKPEVDNMIKAYNKIARIKPTKATSIESLTKDNKALFQNAEKAFADKYLPQGTTLQTRALPKIMKQTVKKDTTGPNANGTGTETNSGLLPVVVGGVVLAGLGALSFWFYNQTKNSLPDEPNEQ